MTSVSTQCPENNGVDLLVDGNLWNSTTLSHPNNERLVVGCRCTSGNGLPEWSYSNGTAIPICRNISKTQICVESITNGTTKNLRFLPFKESHAGQYVCSSRPINITSGIVF